MDSILKHFSKDLGIDLGTCNTLVCVRNEGIVLNEPSVVAVRKGTNIVLNNGEAVGIVAREMLGKTPGSITAIRPLKDGVISDFEITQSMLKYFIRRANGRRRFIPPRVVIAIPSGITAVERRKSSKARAISWSRSASKSYTRRYRSCAVRSRARKRPASSCKVRSQ